MDIYGTIVSLFSGGVITYILGLLAGRKRYKADLEGIRIKNIDAAIDIYARVHKDLKEEFDVVSNKCVKLASDVEIIKKGNMELRQDNVRLRKDNAQLKKENDNLRKDNKFLKRQIDELKQLLNIKN